MNKDLKDYLPFYLGCFCKTKYVDWENWSTETLTLKVLNKLNEDLSFEVKPILRLLKNVTQDEMNEYCDIFWARPNGGKDSDRFKENMFWLQFSDLSKMNIEYVPWLLSKGFDLFGLIDAGLAIQSAPSAQ